MRLESNLEISDWIPLNDLNQLDEADQLSKTKPVVIFKHSTSCGISSVANYRLTKNWVLLDDQVTVYYLDLLSHRNISAEIENRYKIKHQSPQILILENGKVIYHTSHHEVSAESILAALN